MKEVWFICSGQYNGIKCHGFFETEQEAKEYCEWKNKYTSYEWAKVWYTDMEKMSFKEEQECNVIAYNIETKGYKICEDEIEIELVETDATDSCAFIPRNSDGSFSFYFTIVCNDKDKAIKIVQGMIAELKEKYIECQDWNLVMQSIGGDIWS